jgi:hypothetical protein
MSAAPPGVEGAMMRTGGGCGLRLDADDTQYKRDSKTLHPVLDGVLCLCDRHTDDASFAEPSQAATVSLSKPTVSILRHVI